MKEGGLNEKMAEVRVDNCWRFYYHLFQPGRSRER